MRRVLLALALCALVADPSWADIGRTARGTISHANAGAFYETLTGSITVGAGSTLVVFLAYEMGQNSESLPFPIDGLSWNGAAMARSVSSPWYPGGGLLFGGFAHECWTLQNATAGTGTLVATCNSTFNQAPVGNFAGTIVEVTGAAAASYDVSAFNANGIIQSSTEITSPTTTQANETVLASEAVYIGAGTGSWSNTFSTGQAASIGQLNTDDAYVFTTEINPYVTGRHLTAPSFYSAMIATFKQADSGNTTATVYQRSISGRHRVRRRTP